MKSTIKLFLIVALFNSVIIAEEGNMGSGGRTCTPPATSCRIAIETEDADTQTTETDSIFGYIRDYLVSIFE